MDHKINITDFLQFGVDALNIFISAFGVLVFVVSIFVVANMIRDDLLTKRLIKQLDQKEKLRQTKTETPEEKKIRINNINRLMTFPVFPVPCSLSLIKTIRKSKPIHRITVLGSL